MGQVYWVNNEFMILTIIENIQASSNIIDMLLFGTGGSVVTMLTQKLINRKSDNTDIVTKQVQVLNDVNEKLENVVTRLQEVACYRKNCDERLDGSEIEEKPINIKKTRR